MPDFSVHISLTTVPSKFRYLPSTIDSLLNQSVQPADIIINVPRKYTFRFDRSIPETDIAAFLARYGRANVSINRLDRDYGPGTKLLGLLESGHLSRWTGRSYLILVDDDVLYDPSMVKTFCDRIDKERTRFASFRCYWIDDIPIGQGVDGMLIDITLLDLYREYYDVIATEDFVTYHDDLYMSYYFYLRGVPLTFIPFKSYRFKPMGWIDALSSMEGKYSRENVKQQSIAVLDRLNRQHKFDFIKGRTPPRSA